MQSGQMEKAQKYSEKALAQLEKLKIIDGDDSFLRTLQLVLLENCVMCRLVAGNNAGAVREVICRLEFTYNKIYFTFLTSDWNGLRRLRKVSSFIAKPPSAASYFNSKTF